MLPGSRTRVEELADDEDENRRRERARATAGVGRQARVCARDTSRELARAQSHPRTSGRRPSSAPSRTATNRKSPWKKDW